MILVSRFAIGEPGIVGRHGPLKSYVPRIPGGVRGCFAFVRFRGLDGMPR